MDLKGYTTVDEVGEDSQVRNVESFKPSTAAEEIEYLNKILAKMEKGEVKENSKGGKNKIETAISEKDIHRDDTCNNNAVDLITESCNVYVNIEHGNAECEQSCIRNESKDKSELHIEKCALNEITNERTDFNEGYGLLCADDILTQAESQHSDIQENISGHVQNELSTEPSLIMANPSVADLESNSKQTPSCTQSNISSNAELEENLETNSIESITFESSNENGSSELSSSTMEATIMPVNCAAELESGHYSAKDTFDFLSGEDISGSSNLDSVELDVSALSNVVLGDIGSLLNISADISSVAEENTVADCETQVDLSIVKSEPLCSDPGEENDLNDFCNDPAEEFVLNEHNVKEEPIDYPTPAPTASQEEVLLPVKIFKNEDDSDDQVVTPNIRYLVEDHKQYSREEVAAAVIISQSSLSPIIDMEMFQNLGKTKLTVTLSRLENMVQCPKQLALEDLNVIQLFRSKYGTSIQEWKTFFSLEKNYSVKHTGKKNIKKHMDNVSSDRGKGRKGRKKKHMIEKSSNAKSSSCNFKAEAFRGEAGEEKEKGDCHLDESIHVSSINEDPIKLKKEDVESVCDSENSSKLEAEFKTLRKDSVDIKEETKIVKDGDLGNAEEKKSELGVKSENANEESLCDSENSSKLEAESKTLGKESVNKKKRKRKRDKSDLGNAEDETNELGIKNENVQLIMQCADSSVADTMKGNLQEESNKNKSWVSHQLNDLCKACSVHLYDIANDPMYGNIVRKCVKQNNENSKILEHIIEEPLEKSYKKNVISPSLYENENNGVKLDNSSSSVQIEEQIALVVENVKDISTNIRHVNFVDKGLQQKTSLKEENENSSEAVKPDETNVAKKESSDINCCNKNFTSEIKIDFENEAETEIKLKKKIDTGIELEEGDIFQKKRNERARKKLKLHNEDIDAEIRNSPRGRKKTSENSLHRDKFGIDQDTEGNNLKYDDKKKEQLTDVADFKKNKDDVLTSNDTKHLTSSLSTLSSFK